MVSVNSWHTYKSRHAHTATLTARQRERERERLKSKDMYRYSVICNSNVRLFVCSLCEFEGAKAAMHTHCFQTSWSSRRRNEMNERKNHFKCLIFMTFSVVCRVHHVSSSFIIIIVVVVVDVISIGAIVVYAMPSRRSFSVGVYQCWFYMRPRFVTILLFFFCCCRCRCFKWHVYKNACFTHVSPVCMLQNQSLSTAARSFVRYFFSFSSSSFPFSSFHWKFSRSWKYWSVLCVFFLRFLNSCALFFSFGG